MEEIIFIPKYQGNLPRYLWIIPLILLLSLPFINISSLLGTWIAISYIFLGLLVILIYMLLVKEIRFRDRIILRRYLSPDQTVSYSDVQNVIPVGFRIRWSFIYWNTMENSDELKQIVKGLIEEGVIPEH